MIEKLNAEIPWSDLPQRAEELIRQAIAIQQIPAPTFAESVRAAYVADQFQQLGLQSVRVDDLHNVYGLIPGKRENLPGVLISAHTDTVFAADTDLTIRRTDGLIYGPGLGDNSIGVAGLLAFAEFVRDHRLTPERNIWLVANTREEGLGDLGGIKLAFETLRPQIASVINLEGMAFGYVYHAGIAVRRLHITAEADGGHSWLHFGRASAVHGIMNLGTQITAIVPVSNPRTTYNIGMIDGGQAINVIATKSSLWLDLRSEDFQELLRLEQQVRSLVKNMTSQDLRFSIEIVGDRPAGSISTDHPLVQAGLTMLTLLGVRATLETGSTDANVPLAAGCPAITIGITRGGNAHRLDEYVEVEPVAQGLRQLVVLALAAAAYNKT